MEKFRMFKGENSLPKLSMLLDAKCGVQEGLKTLMRDQGSTSLRGESTNIGNTKADLSNVLVSWLEAKTLSFSE
jgi:hypothetical protein